MYEREDANFLIAKFNIIIDERLSKSGKNASGGYDETAMNNENLDGTNDNTMTHYVYKK